MSPESARRAPVSTHRTSRWVSAEVARNARLAEEERRLHEPVDPVIIEEARRVVVAVRNRILSLSEIGQGPIDLLDETSGAAYDVSDYSRYGFRDPIRIEIYDPRVRPGVTRVIRLAGEPDQITPQSSYLNARSVSGLVTGLGEKLMRAREITNSEYFGYKINGSVPRRQVA